METLTFNYEYLNADDVKLRIKDWGPEYGELCTFMEGLNKAQMSPEVMDKINSAPAFKALLGVVYDYLTSLSMIDVVDRKWYAYKAKRISQRDSDITFRGVPLYGVRTITYPLPTSPKYDIMLLESVEDLVNQPNRILEKVIKTFSPVGPDMTLMPDMPDRPSSGNSTFQQQRKRKERIMMVNRGKVLTDAKVARQGDSPQHSTSTGATRSTFTPVIHKPPDVSLLRRLNAS